MVLILSLVKLLSCNIFKKQSAVGLCILYFDANIQLLAIRIMKLIIDIFYMFYQRYQNCFYYTLSLFPNCYLLRTLHF